MGLTGTCAPPQILALLARAWPHPLGTLPSNISARGRVPLWAENVENPRIESEGRRKWAQVVPGEV